MKAITYDPRPGTGASGRTFTALALAAAALQVASLYVLLAPLSGGGLPQDAWANRLPDPVRPYLIAAPGAANLLVLCATGLWFRRFMRRRVRDERRLRESESFARATVDALPTHIAILDANGGVLATNRAWREFAAANGDGAKLVRDAPNYLAECDALAGRQMAEAAALAAGIRAVAAGHRDVFLMEYDCHEPPRGPDGRPR